MEFELESLQPWLIRARSIFACLINHWTSSYPFSTLNFNLDLYRVLTSKSSIKKQVPPENTLDKRRGLLPMFYLIWMSTPFTFWRCSLKRGKIFLKQFFKKLISAGAIVCSQTTPTVNFSRFPSVTAYVLRAPSSQPIGVLSGLLLKLHALELPDNEFPS